MRRREPAAARVEPQRGRPGQDPDAVPGPDRVPVLDALGVVPHPVAVDQAAAGSFGDGQHPAVDVLGHPADHPVRRGTEAVRPVRADQVEVAADAAGGHDHRGSVQLELANLGARAAGAARGLARLEDRPLYAVHRPAGDGEPVHPVPEPQPDQARPRRLPDLPLERSHHGRAGAPRDVEAGHRVAVPVGQVAAPLGPADQRKPPHPHAMQPGPLLPGGEVDVGLRPPVRPVVLARRVVGPAVEERAAHPVLPGQLAGDPDTHPALLRAGDQEQAAERPEGLAAQVRLGLLVEQQHPPSGPRQLRGGGQSRQPRAHHDRIRVHLVIKSGRVLR